MPHAAAPTPPDPGIPGARGLFSGEGERAVRAFLGERGWEADAVRPVQVVLRPGRTCLVRYRVAATGPRGRSGLTLCAEAGSASRDPVPAPDDFERRFGIGDPVGRAGGYLVWAYPYDPSLRELPDAAWGPAVRDRLGVPAVAVQPLRYRPRRRGVFRYRLLRRHGGDRIWETAYGKVIPRTKAKRLADLLPILERARSLRIAPAHPMLGRQTLVFEELAGRSLRDLLLRGGSLPSPARVAAVPHRLAAEIEGRAPITWERPAAPDVARGAAMLAATILPQAAPLAERVADAVGERAGDVTLRPVHGDLYEAQLFVGNRFEVGLIDLDDVALGDPAMDAANFCAHLLVLALSVPAAAGRLAAYRGLVRPAFAASLGIAERDLAWREALCVLQLSTGPFRVLDPAWPAEVERRLRLAVRLLG